MAPLTVSSTRRLALAIPEASSLTAAAGESGQKGECEKEPESAAPSSDLSVPLPQSNPAPDSNTSSLNLNLQMEPQMQEVQCLTYVSSKSVFYFEIILRLTMCLEENDEAFQTNCVLL